MTKNWFTWLSLDRPLYWHQYNERNPRAPSLQDVYSGTMVLQPWLLYQITPSLTMRKKIFFVESSAISYCPICGEPLAYRDSCQRIMLLEGRERRIYIIRRLKCHQCGRIHRELPDCLAPFKHYATEVISGVLDGIVTPEDDDSADYLRLWKCQPGNTPVFSGKRRYVLSHFNVRSFAEKGTVFGMHYVDF